MIHSKIATATPAQWQHWILLLAATWLLFQMWKGWKLGLFRSILRFVTILAAWFAGSAAVVAVKVGLGFFWADPPQLLTTVIAAIVGAVVYLIFSFLSRLLFRSEIQHRGLIGIFLGLAGAFCGFLFGAFFLWGGISVIRTLGMLEEAHFLSSQNLKVPQVAGSGETFIGPPEGKGAFPHPFAGKLITLKEALETGPTGEMIKRADPLSASFYDTMKKSVELVQDPAALERFINMPEVQEILTSPPIVEMIEDPKVQKDLSTFNITGLLSNSHVRSMFHNQELRDELKSLRLNAAITRALHPAGKTKPPVQQAAPSGFFRDASEMQDPTSSMTPSAAEDQIQEPSEEKPEDIETTFEDEQGSLPPSSSGRRGVPPVSSEEFYPGDAR